MELFLEFINKKAEVMKPRTTPQTEIKVIQKPVFRQTRLDRIMMKIIIVILSALICLITTRLYALDDPFDSPPVNSIRNCSEEYRFKYSENITTPEAFIEFLKKHHESYWQRDAL